MGTLSNLDKIQNYIQNMFVNLPKTPEIEQLKQNISDTMEDKFTELLSRGKNADEALGIVFSEFGSMEELCEEMGIPLRMQSDKTSFQPSEKQSSEAKAEIKNTTQHHDEDITGNICGIIMMLAVIVFLILGLWKNLWHPAWAILPVCGILCGIISNVIHLLRKQQK